MSLVFASLYSELEGPALKNIVQETHQGFPYLDQIIYRPGMISANEKQYRHALEYFLTCHRNFKVLLERWPLALRAIDLKLFEQGFGADGNG